jgi:hypothetical protein
VAEVLVVFLINQLFLPLLRQQLLSVVVVQGGQRQVAAITELILLLGLIPLQAVAVVAVISSLQPLAVLEVEGPHSKTQQAQTELQDKVTEVVTAIRQELIHRVLVAVAVQGLLVVMA